MTQRQLFTPKGVRDFLPQEAAWRRELEDRIYRVVESYGYQEVVTPTIENLALFGRSNDPDDTQVYRFIDRDGESIALRPDMTTPIARVVTAHLRKEPLPLRLCYFGNLFRYADPHAGRQREFTQAGVELLGSSRPEADAEVIILAYRALEAAGIRDFRLDIGHVGFMQEVLKRAKLSTDVEEGIKKALVHKDLVRVEQLVTAHVQEDKLRRILCELDNFRGGAEVIDQAAEVFSGQAIPALINLKTIVEQLKAAGLEERITIDLSMVKAMDYYTGMVLEGYSRELGYYLCSGGRYDGLLGEFGYELPATGFALGIDRVLLALERQGFDDWKQPKRFVVRFPETLRAEALLWIERWRKTGVVLISDLGESTTAHDERIIEFLQTGEVVYQCEAGRKVMQPDAFNPTEI
jgi:ATP phosphoribosyltransferase regulatory subunit